ncbi:MAG: biotin synthase BioB [Clostridiales bacterium]|nr:biotin synthase BioB [Clostridiales bacterium]
MKALADEIIKGRRLTREDDLSVFLEADLDSLCEGADSIRQALCGDRVDLCSIINGRGGRCSENCKFCAQSAHHHTNCEEYGFLDQDSLLEGCAHAWKNGVDRYSIVTAGRTMEGEDLEKALEAYEAMHQEYPDIQLCASHGLMKEEDLKRLVQAGVTMYHANVETARRYFPEICTTHTYEDKLSEIRKAKNAGLHICSGGILGMGETWQDRIDMAVELSELEVSSIPLNFLIPIPGTPLEGVTPLKPEEILRIVAIFRYLNPDTDIRVAAGRNYFSDGGEALFKAGANATITGDMLTTVGNNTAQDRAMLTKLGFQIKKERKDESEQ